MGVLPEVCLLLPLTSVDCSLGLKDLIASSLELSVHAGSAALMGCVFQSTEDRRVTKVDWVFSPGEHAKVRCVVEAPGPRCQDSVGTGRSRSSGAVGCCGRSLGPSWAWTLVVGSAQPPRASPAPIR